MTVAVLLATPPRPGAVLDRLPETAPVTPAEAADCYAAMLRDVALAVDDSTADLLVNHPPAEETDADDPDAALREELGDVGVAEAARFEVQVGSTFSARVGNAVTHLLDAEGETSVLALTPDTPLVTRSDLDTVGMRLRRDDVVLGPTTEGRLYAAGFTDTVDFAGAFAPPALDTVARRARDAALDVDFLPMGLRVATGADLRSLLAVLTARRTAGRSVPSHTAAWVDDLGLALEPTDGGVALARA